MEGSCDDYAGLQEVLGRRLKGLTANAEEVAWERPDLLVIDGGKGQLGAVVDVMNRLHEIFLKVRVTAVVDPSLA